MRFWAYKETGLTIKSDSERAIDEIISAAMRAREEVERYSALFPEFRWSLEPLELEGSHPRVIELMLEAGKLAGVGPFAAVAGAIAQVAAEAALEAGATEVVVENGGDIAVAGKRSFRVGIFAGDSELSGKLAFELLPEDLPAGVCTSSGRVGHSISFGDAEAVSVIARDASVADAAATAIANEVRGERAEEAIDRGLRRARGIPRIRGGLIFRGNAVGAWGKLPKLVWLSHDPALAEIFKRYQEYGLFGR